MDRLVDAIKEGQIITIPESQAREEELFILRVHEKKDPSADLPSIESRRRSGRSAVPLAPRPTTKWHSYQSEYSKNNVVRELKDNFHWEIGKARRERSLTRLQLANAINVPENAIKMVENGELPSDDFVLVNKLQNYLGVQLRKDGKTFEAPLPKLTPSSAASTPKGPAYVPKPDFTRKDLSLSDLQRMKSQREKARQMSGEQTSKDSLAGDDIELFE